MRKEIYTDRGPKPGGIYSQGILAGGPTVYISGQVPVDPETGERESGSFRAQAERVFRNVQILLEEAGTSWAHAVRVGVYLADLNDFAEMNEVYQTFVRKPYPARTTLGVNLLGFAIEVDCIAVVPQEE